MRTALVLSALLLTAACGQNGTPAPAAAPGSATPDATADATAAPVSVASPRRAGGWPDLRPPTAASCVSRYPDGLRANTTAVDATVTAVAVGEFDDNAGMRPATVELAVHEAIAGPDRTTLSLRTWDGFLPRPDPQAAVGLRVLASAGDTLDLMGCGYTRPYDPAEAQRWRTVFAGPAPSPTPDAPTRASVSMVGDMNKGDDGLRADFRVTVRRPDGGRVLAYSVSWGDGESASTSVPGTCPAAPGPLADDFVIRHAYPQHGLYNVIVNVVTGGCDAPEDTARGTAEAAVGPQPGSH